MKKQEIIILATAIFLASSIRAQGSWREPVSIKDFHVMINAIRTDPTKFEARVKNLFEDQRNAAGVHNLLGATYTDLQITNMKSYLSSASSVGAVELDRGLTVVAWKHAQHMATMNSLGGGLGPTGLDLAGRVGAMGTATGSLQEVRAVTLPQGHTAELVILSRMILSTDDRAIIRNPVHNKLGVGLDKRINQYYVELIFSEGFTCTKCHEITDSEEENSFWNQYQREWYNPPDTDGNLRINRAARILSVVGSVFVCAIASILN
jgi:hypothetical protein